MYPSWPQQFTLETTEICSPLSGEAMSVLGLTHETGEVNKVVGKYTECFARNYLDTCFICFLLLLKLDQRAFTWISLFFVVFHAGFHKKPNLCNENHQ